MIISPLPTDGPLTEEELQLAARNKGMPLEGLRYDLTPTGMHYLLVHFDIPDVDAAAWRLQLGGAFERPLALDPRPDCARARGDAARDAGVRRQRPRPPPPPPDQPAVAERGGRHRATGPARRSPAARRGRPRRRTRSRWCSPAPTTGSRRATSTTTRAASTLADASAPRGAARLRDERPAARAAARLPAAPPGPRLVRHDAA